MGELVDCQMPLGGDPEIDEARYYNGTGQALVEGDCVFLDETRHGQDGSAAANTTTNPTVGVPTAVRLAVANDKGANGGIAAWAQEAIPIAGIGKFRLNGTSIVRLAADLNANVARQLAAPAAGATTMAAAAATEKVLAKALTPVNVVVLSNARCPAWVKGISGFGGSIT